MSEESKSVYVSYIELVRISLDAAQRIGSEIELHHGGLIKLFKEIDALQARIAELEEIDKLRSESVSTLNQANANNEDEIELLEKCIAELNAFIDRLIEAGDEMSDQSYWHENKWQALVKVWKERER